jgi:hypothetical protein
VADPIQNPPPSVSVATVIRWCRRWPKGQTNPGTTTNAPEANHECR